MPGTHRYRGAALSALAVLSFTAVPAFTTQGPVAQPVRGAIRDGAPNADVCKRYGFEHYGGHDEGRGYGRGGTGGYRAPAVRAPGPQMAPPPPPPPPPMPPPPPAFQQAPSAVSPPPAQESQRRGGLVAGDAVGRGRPQAPYPGQPGHPVDTERYPHASANPVHRTAETPVSTFSIDVDTASYANVRRFISEGQRPPRDAVRVEELINYFDYGYPLPQSRREPFRIFTAVAPSPWSEGRQILHIGVQGYNLPRTQRPPLNLVFLVDTSGSMSGADRLPLAIQSLNTLVDGLRPEDRVSLVAYAGSAGAVLGPTSGADRLRIRCALGSLHSGGSTAGGQGLALAYSLAQQNFRQGAVNRVILMTDGDFNVGIADPQRLRDFVSEKRSTGVYLSVYGFGRGNYNDTMMQALAQNGNGVAGYIDSLQEARRVFRNDFTQSLFTIANDVKIQVEFNPAVVAEYRLIGYETRLLNREDFNNDQVDAGDVGSGASVTALYEITPVGARPSSDPLRYGNEPRAGFTGGVPARAAEFAFVKLRYKRPGEGTSNLITHPVRWSDAYPTLARAPEQTRWAIAVAGYGQRLRGDPWLREGFGWNDIVRLASSALGADPDGERREFIALARSAGSGRSVNE